MKKIVYTLLGIIIGLNCNAQIEKGKFLFGIEGGFTKEPTEMGVTSNVLQTSGKKLNLAGGIEYVFSESLSAGIGLDYAWNKDERTNSIFLDGSLSFVQNEMMEIKQRILLPNIHITHHYKVIDDLYISTSFAFSYGKVKTEYNTTIASINQESNTYMPSLSGSATSRSMEEETDSELSSISLSPKINYFVFKRIGLYLSLGAMEYSLIDWETDNSIWGVNFSPKYWQLGVNILL